MNRALDQPVEEVTDSARDMVTSFLEAVPRIGVAVVIVLLGYALSRLLRRVMHRWLRRNRTPSFAGDEQARRLGVLRVAALAPPRPPSPR